MRITKATLASVKRERGSFQEIVVLCNSTTTPLPIKGIIIPNEFSNAVLYGVVLTFNLRSIKTIKDILFLL